MRSKSLCILLFAAVFALCSLSITKSAHAVAFRSPSLGGATGLLTTPTARTGWEGAYMGLDVGIAYSAMGESSYYPKATLELLDRLELGGCFEMQDEHESGRDENDLFLHGKFRFYPWTGSASSALAVGVNYMSLKVNDESVTNYQVYLAATYSGNFFKMPAETTIVFGKTLGDDDYIDEDNWDFSMGFDLDLFPNMFKGYVHWISDFANYSYTTDPKRNVAGDRGSFNTGIRIAALKGHRKYKLNFDLFYLDLLDDDREWGAAVTFGLAL